MTDSGPAWQATPRAGLYKTGELHESNRPKRSWIRRHPKQTIALGVLLLTAFVFVIVQTFVFQIVNVPTAAMAPTFDTSDRIVINRLDTSPKRGDIIVVEDADGGELVVRRVIAFAGETVSANAGVVTIDGATAIEPYLDSESRQGNLSPYTVPDGHIFLLVDDRQQAYDSPLTGAVDIDAIVGNMIWGF